MIRSYDHNFDHKLWEKCDHGTLQPPWLLPPCFPLWLLKICNVCDQKAGSRSNITKHITALCSLHGSQASPRGCTSSTPSASEQSPARPETNGWSVNFKLFQFSLVWNTSHLKAWQIIAFLRLFRCYPCWWSEMGEEICLICIWWIIQRIGSSCSVSLQFAKNVPRHFENDMCSRNTQEGR